MKYMGIALALFASTTTFAANQQTATIVNDMFHSNIHIEYIICDGNDCNGSSTVHRFFTDEPNYLVVNLKPNQNIRIKYAEEIDYQSGNPIPNGARGSFGEDCKANAGQTLELYPGFHGRTLGMIFCQVNK